MLTAKQQRFVAEYLKDLNGKQAAIRAGYKPSNAESTASTLLADPKVSKAVADGRAKQLQSLDFDAQRILIELGRLALVDLRDFFDAAGNLKPIKELTPAQGACLASFEVIKKNAEAGDGLIDTVHKFKVWDKSKALDTLAKHFNLLVEKVEHSGEIVYKWAE